PIGATLFSGGTNDYTIDPSALNNATAPITLRATQTITFQDEVSLGSALATLDVEALRNIVVEAGISSPADITLRANQENTPAFGNFVGIDVDGATVQTRGAGSITLQGRGGNHPITAGHEGVRVWEGAVVEATGSGGVTLTGTGGSGVVGNVGVQVG